MRILVIDDDPSVLETLKAFFAKDGHDVICVGTAREGRRLALVEQPDLVLLDIRLPDINGVELLRQLKEIDREMAVVMITAYKDAEKVIDSFRAGAFDCLLKPFNFDYLANSIVAHIPRRVA